MYDKQFDSQIYGKYNARLAVVVTEQLVTQVAKRLNKEVEDTWHLVQDEMTAHLVMGVQFPFHLYQYKDTSSQAIFLPMEGMNTDWSIEGTGFQAWAAHVRIEPSGKFPVNIAQEDLDAFLALFPEFTPYASVKSDADLVEQYRPAKQSLH